MTQAVWGDETEVVSAVVQWAARRVGRPTDSMTTARPASELAAAAGRTVTATGIGGAEALRVFREILEPATRAQDDPMNLAYIPSAPTRAAVAFDLLTSAANVFAGTWEAGAGAIYAENEALAWLIELLGWTPSAAGCFVAGGTTGNLSALSAARHCAQSRRGERPPGGWKLACTAEVHSSIQVSARVLDVGVVEVPEDLRGHLTGQALAATLAQHRDDVFAVVASAGTTKLVCEPELSVLLFERPGWSDSEYAAWSAALAKAGVILCVPTKSHGRTVLRLAFVNPGTQPARVIEVLQTLR